MSADEVHVVLPLDDPGAGSPPPDPWELLARDRGVLLTWLPGQEAHGPTFGAAIPAAGAVARGLSEAVRAAGAGQLLGQGLFRVEMPVGTSLSQLTPAIGGGYRAMVHSGGKIAGNARLVPVGGLSLGAAAVALGPTLALLGIAVTAEIIAKRQLDARLEKLQQTVDWLKRNEEEKEWAGLDTAERAIRKASAALLDRAPVPTAVGLDTAANHVGVIRDRGVRHLTAWEAGLKAMRHGDLEVDNVALRRALGIESGEPADFAHRVGLLYRALVLDSRATVVSLAEAELASAGGSLDRFTDHVARDVEGNARVMDRLHSVLRQAATLRPTFDSFAAGGTGRKVAVLDATLRHLALHMAPQPVELRTGDRGRHVLEIARSETGELRVHEPTAATARNPEEVPVG
jgi:hypothetical protein